MSKKVWISGLVVLALALGTFVVVEKSDFEFDPLGLKKIEKLEQRFVMLEKQLQLAFGLVGSQMRQVLQAAIIGDCQSVAKLCEVENNRRNATNKLGESLCNVQKKIPGQNKCSVPKEPLLDCKRIQQQCVDQALGVVK